MVPDTICPGLVSIVAVIKHSEQKQLGEEKELLHLRG